MLGFMTVVFSIHSLLGVMNDTVGPGDTVQVLLLGPESRLNRGSNASGGFAINGVTDNFLNILQPKNRPDVVLQTQPFSQYPKAYNTRREQDGQLQRCGSRREGWVWGAIFDGVGVTGLLALWLDIATADGRAEGPS